VKPLCSTNRLKEFATSSRGRAAMEVVAAETTAAIGTLAAVDRSQRDDHNRINRLCRRDLIALSCGRL
jgi:hypothetical protein